MGTVKKVYIGDPSYVVSESKWELICDQMKAANNWNEFEDGLLVAHATQFGDGVFPSSYCKNGYGVDSGMLGIVPDYLISNWEEAERLGNVREFDEVKSTCIEYCEDGTIYFYVNDKIVDVTFTGEELYDEENQ